MRPVEKTSITDQVVDSIRELIESDGIDVGDKMPTEQQLSSQLNVGRSTVREALRMLQAFGFIELRPGKGAFLARKQVEGTEEIAKWFFDHRVQLKDYMELRRALEPVAVELAIERASSREIAEMEKVLDQFDIAAEKRDVLKLVSLDERFHRLIVEATHNALFINITRVIEKALFEYRKRAFSVDENVGHAIGPHRQILEAIRNRDSASGAGEMVLHIELSLRDISSVIEKAR